MNENEPRMVVVARPDEGGKSTVTQGLALADKIPELKAVTDPLSRNRQAAEFGDETGKAALKSGPPFALETLLSRQGKLALFDETRDKGSNVDPIFITTANAAINAERVGFRLAKGGHPIPGEKVAERYDRAMQLLPSAIQKADTAEMYDKSSSERRPLLLACLDRGGLLAEFNIKQLCCEPEKGSWRS